MRLITLILITATLAACEKYTDATSPCFGKNGEPVVSRAASAPLALDVSGSPEKDCLFEDIGQPK